jgi:integrase
VSPLPSTTPPKILPKRLREIAHHRTNFITLRGPEAYHFQEAVGLLDAAGLSVRQAAHVVLDSHRLLGGTAGIADAVKYYVENRPRKSADISVRQTVDELLALRQREGTAGRLHLRDLRNRLGRFAEKFNCPICKVSPQAIRDYILSQQASERTRHNLRTTLGMLFNFAAAEGYLPADRKGVPRPTKRRLPKVAVQVFTPEEMSRLLNAATGSQLVTLAICGFAGIRAEECKRLQWEHLNFESGTLLCRIRSPSAKPGASCL